jgi:methionyl-tRNA synthetase
MSKFYVTTPIYYVNDEPHIGHAYTTLLADVLARYHRLMGDEVYFLTGTDEHGQKVQEAAAARGVDPQKHCDEMVVRFQELWQRLGIRHDDFIRTTEPRHKQVVAEVLDRLYAKGEIYRGSYEGWYCVPDERFWTEKDLLDGNCPLCGRPTRKITETNYFFRMSRYRDWLIRYIEEHPRFILPETRRNEVLGFLRQPLEDLCISRPRSRLAWGIPLPFDRDYVTYVWFDALLNYYSAVKGRTTPSGKPLWPATLHLIGKDILTTHAVYWPTMLKAAELELPETLVAHGWWLVQEQKMSKSVGNVVRPLDLAEVYGVDAFRYFLVREMVVGQDCDFSEEALVARFNSDLANDLGNLQSRVEKMILNYAEGRIPSPGASGDPEIRLENLARETVPRVMDHVRDVRIHQAVEDTLQLVRAVNRYLEERSPWKAVKEAPETVPTTLWTAAEGLRLSWVLLSPVMPGKAAEALGRMGALEEPSGAPDPDHLVWGRLRAGTEVRGGPGLFPRVNR